MNLFDGRYNRSKYLYWVIIVNVILIVGGWFLDYDIEKYKYEEFIISSIVYSILSLIPTVKRFHDMNMHGAHAILLFIPVLNIYYYLILLFKKGTEGSNEFGPDPLTEERVCSNCSKEIIIDDDEVGSGYFTCPACNAVNAVQ